MPMYVLVTVVFAVLLAGCDASAPVAKEVPLNWVPAQVVAEGLHLHTFESAVAGQRVGYHVLLPPGYANSPDARYPVVYWLHGSGGGNEGLPFLARYFREAMLRSAMPHALVVFPYGFANGMWIDARDGSAPVESMFIRDLIPHIDATYRTVAERGGRILEGYSMGGYGVGRLGFLHANLFGGLSMWGAGPLQTDFTVGPLSMESTRRLVLQRVYGNSLAWFEQQSPWRIAERTTLPEGTPFRILIGTADETYPYNRAYHLHLVTLKIPHTYTELPGIGHNAIAMAQTMGDDAFGFYWEVFGGG
jgi:enterochelin esterase-like enzyme